MKKTSIYITIIVLVLAVIIAITAYASLSPIVNVENMNTNTYLGGQVSLTTSDGGEIASNISSLLMSEMEVGNTIVVGNTILNVTLTTSNSKQICCDYDIVWEWDQTNVAANQYSLTTGAIKEYTLSGTYDEYYGSSSASTLGATNAYMFEKQLQNYNASSLSSPMTRATICNNPSKSENVKMHSWNLTANFYNLDVNQDDLKNGVFTGRAKVSNVSCIAKQTLADYIANDAPKSGTDAVSSSPWVLASDRAGEYRYAGKNPDNYIQFNGELWRIIGVMPNIEYCTGEYGNANECDTTTTGSLVKIIRNDSLGGFAFDIKKTGVGSSPDSYGSNDWSDSQLMLMLNGDAYLKTSYDMHNNQLHTGYTNNQGTIKDSNGISFYNVSYNYLDGNGTTVYKPSSATTSSYTATEETISKKIDASALSHIATAKWNLYGASNQSLIETGTSPNTWYKIERNIDNHGGVYNYLSLQENRPVYWYGKIGLMYPSDYAYATNGDGSVNSEFSRTKCLNSNTDDWTTTGDYHTCAINDWFHHYTISSFLGIKSGWTITPYSDFYRSEYLLREGSDVDSIIVQGAYRIYPTLYLNADTLITGGNGTWSNPYTIETKQYWHSNLYAAFPYYGGTLYSSASETGYSDNIGQDGSKHYVCASDNNAHEICLSQPYTQYGLTDHTENTSFTSDQQTSAKQALYQAFTNAGFSINIDSNCGTSANAVYCRAGNTECTIDSNGYIYCGTCMLSNTDYASCRS